ncbi:MAG: hypothetical protein WKG01_32560 [Kofleriaceae bacterium]
MGAQAMTSFQASDHTLHSVQLIRDEAEDEDHVAATRELLAAITDLTAGWLEPLGVGIRVECRDPEDFMQASGAPSDPHLFLRVADWPAAAVENVGFTDARVREVPALEPSRIADAVAELTLRPCGPGLVTVFDQLLWTAVRARLPVADAVALDGNTPLVLSLEQRDGATWAIGPTTGPHGAPVRLRAINAEGKAEITLAIQWSIWADLPAIVDEGVARVLARGRGWQLS